jgi:hypothetical protein
MLIDRRRFLGTTGAEIVMLAITAEARQSSRQ